MSNDAKQTQAAGILDIVEQTVRDAAEHEISAQGKVLAMAFVAVTREILERAASIDASLKSIAASQVIVAKEAEESLQMLEEARGPGESTTAEQANDWHDETL